MEQLDEEKFPKLMAYLNNPISRRVRTNNHVGGRTNHMFRFLEKVRYKWPRRKTLVRFVVLTLDDVWSDWEPPMVRGADRSKTVKHGKTHLKPDKHNVKSRDSLVEISEESHKIRETHRGFVEKCHALNDGPAGSTTRRAQGPLCDPDSGTAGEGPRASSRIGSSWSGAISAGSMKTRSLSSARRSPNDSSPLPTSLTFPTKVPSDSLGQIGSLKRTSDKSLFPMALGNSGHRITHQLRPINMNGRSILAVTSILP